MYLPENETAGVDAYDDPADEGLADYRDQIDRLMTVPGFDHATALSILVELGTDSPRNATALPGPDPTLPGQLRERRQMPQRTHPTRQHHLARGAHRVCARRRTNASSAAIRRH